MIKLINKNQPKSNARNCSILLFTCLVNETNDFSRVSRMKHMCTLSLRLCCACNFLFFFFLLQNIVFLAASFWHSRALFMQRFVVIISCVPGFPLKTEDDMMKCFLASKNQNSHGTRTKMPCVCVCYKIVRLISTQNVKPNRIVYFSLSWVFHAKMFSARMFINLISKHLGKV